MGVLLTASVHPVIRRLASGARGRTSTAPAEAAGQRAAQSRAASSEGSSRMMNLDDSRDLNDSRDFNDTSSLGLDWLGNQVLAPAIFLSAHEL
jgi:hypothetical protein